MTVEIRTDENGYFCRTIPFDAAGSPPAAERLTLTLLSPFATGLWGELDIEAADSEQFNEKRAFVVWHSETVELGSWRLAEGENIIVVTGKTKPRRAHVRLVIEIDVALQ